MKRWLQQKPGLGLQEHVATRIFLELLGGGALGLLGQGGMDVGHDSAGGDGGAAEEAVELVVVLDRQLDVAGVDAVLLHLLGSVARELENLGDEVLHDRGHVHRRAGAHALGGAGLAEIAAHPTDGEGEAGLGRRGLAVAGFLGRFAGTLGGHLDLFFCLKFGRNVVIVWFATVVES